MSERPSGAGKKPGKARGGPRRDVFEGKTRKELTELFRKLGAADPEAWASSQLDEDIDQLSRFVFLREAWKAVASEGDFDWIDENIRSAKRHPDEPLAGMGPALERMLAAGVDRRDILEVVRVMQYEVLFSLCYLLEDPGSLEPELDGLVWQLVRTNEDGKVIGPIGGLHESLLETDPTGREMRPKGA